MGGLEEVSGPVGRDCVGALQFLPDGADPGPAGGIEGRPLGDKEIADILGDLKRTPLGVDESEEFRISLAGAKRYCCIGRISGRCPMAARRRRTS